MKLLGKYLTDKNKKYTGKLLELRIGGLSKDNCATIVLLFVFKAF